MADVEHNTLGNSANQHAFTRWAPANEAARFALVVTSDDVGKVARQLDTQTFWALIDEASVGSAAGWQELDGVTAAAAAAAAQADATQALSDAADAQAVADTHASRHLPGGADEVNALAAGANLTDADQTIQWSSTDGYRRLPASTLTTDRTKTLGVTNAVAGSTWVLDIYAQGASNDCIIVNGGSGAGTIETIAGGAKVRYVVRYDGNNWVKGSRMPLA